MSGPGRLSPPCTSSRRGEAARGGPAARAEVRRITQRAQVEGCEARSRRTTGRACRLPPIRAPARVAEGTSSRDTGRAAPGACWDTPDRRPRSRRVDWTHGLARWTGGLAGWTDGLAGWTGAGSVRKIAVWCLRGELASRSTAVSAGNRNTDRERQGRHRRNPPDQRKVAKARVRAHGILRFSSALGSRRTMQPGPMQPRPPGSGPASLRRRPLSPWSPWRSTRPAESSSNPPAHSAERGRARGYLPAARRRG